MKKSISFLFLILSLKTFGAQVKIPVKSEYVSGKALCALNPDLVKNEKGFHVEVPVNHQNPMGPKFDLYAWFQGDYKPERPTVAYLTGGPGLSSHWGLYAVKSEQYNFLLIDQRGIACSKPRAFEDYLHPEFYSSLNVALDLEVVRKHLKIKSWSLYAVSYGTIPATIYASKFPKASRSLILEGVAFDASSLWNQVRRKDLILQSIKTQSPEVQNRLKIIDLYGAKSSWFFNWARDELMWNNGRSHLMTKLKRLEDMKEFLSFVDMLKAQYGPGPEYPKNELFVMNEIPYYMIACQELGLLNFMSDLRWSDRSDVVPAFSPDVKANCGLVGAPAKKDYSAQNFPVSVPVFYFQGENDGATEVGGSLKHFTLVAKGMKQFFLLKEGGHNPNLEILKDENSVQKKLFLNAVLGVKSPLNVVQEVNSNLKDLQWEVLPKEPF